MGESPAYDVPPGDLLEDRFREFFRLTAEEEEALSGALGPIQQFPRDHVLRRDGAEPIHLYLLVEGWVAASIPLTSGKQQIVKIHLPRDLVGAASLCVIRAADCLTAVTPVAVRKISRADLMSLFVRYPRIASSLFLSAQKERVALMDSLAIRQSEGGVRIAGMLTDLHDRLAALGLVTDGAFQLPLTQDQIGDLVGLSPVHVNRKLREMDNAGIIERTGRMIRLCDIDRLRAMANLPSHTYLRDSDWVVLA